MERKIIQKSIAFLISFFLVSSIAAQCPAESGVGTLPDGNFNVLSDAQGSYLELSGTGRVTEAKLKSELGCDVNGQNCTYDRIVIQTGACIYLNGDWDLRSVGFVTIEIKGTGSLRFSGSGTNAEELFLLHDPLGPPTSQIIIENTSNTSALFAIGGVGQNRIFFYTSLGDIVSPSPYDENNFSLIITSGGVNGFGLGILPVTLLSFTAAPVAEGIQLTWTTATELNNDYMAVERSPDGVTFDEIERIPGRGTTYQPQSYEYLDAFPAPGINYYRLRQVDYDGTTEYHPVISVVFAGQSRLELAVFPNPAGDELRVRWSAPARQEGTLRLLNTAGQELARRRLPAGGGVYYLPVNELAPGLYVLQVQQGGQMKTLRFGKE